MIGTFFPWYKDVVLEMWIINFNEEWFWAQVKRDLPFSCMNWSDISYENFFFYSTVKEEIS